MRIYYICPRRVWEEPIDFGGFTLPACNLFHNGIGSSCIHLDDAGEWFLVSTDFASDVSQEIWHSHPEVARLTHPTQQANVPLSDLYQKPDYAHKQFTQQHWNLLATRFGLNPSHTVWDLHQRAIAIDPCCRLTNVY